MPTETTPLNIHNNHALQRNEGAINSIIPNSEDLSQLALYAITQNHG